MSGCRASPDPGPLRALLDPPVTSWLADVGGGTGRVGRSLRDLAGQVVVVDPSAAMLSGARPPDGVHRVRGRAEDLPFADGSLARMVAVDAFHHSRHVVVDGTAARGRSGKSVAASVGHVEKHPTADCTRAGETAKHMTISS